MDESSARLHTNKEYVNSLKDVFAAVHGGRFPSVYYVDEEVQNA